MAEKACNLIKNGGSMSKYKVVATANANQTYENQLAQLKSAFQLLSADEKIGSVLTDGSVVFFPNGTSGGYYRITCGTDGSVLMRCATLYDTKYFVGSFTSPLPNVSSNTNTNVMTLYTLA